ncbi:MAG: hypothetical protein LBR73_09695 [Oscillospiraceae bacterium]|jgi:hypothetical protein|nr:hypothetical protein [Oscillospiraceae bacterium]
MPRKRIVNIINFIRAYEPRGDVDLLMPIRMQVGLLRKHSLPGTFPLMYNALQDTDILDILRTAPTGTEFSLWFEMCAELCKAAGVHWRGRWAWDWESHCAFSPGYTPPEREALLDAAFEKFREVFGYYPRSMGAWAFDAHTLRYAAEKYGMDAFCNCKDQLGTDGYTLWGGYYNGGYYPSVYNAYCPAQSEENQIHVPMFRMLGSCPLYQYIEGLNTHTGLRRSQGVLSLEPSSERCGARTEWVDWYLRENFIGKCLSHAYTQVGQENSFGWENMENLPYQLARIAELRDKGIVTAETLAASGRWFRENFNLTPAAGMLTESDWTLLPGAAGCDGRGEPLTQFKTNAGLAGKDCKGFWYNCRNYRANVFIADNRPYLRDLHLFREERRENYLTETEPTENLFYETIPLMDGNRRSGRDCHAGWYPLINGRHMEILSYIYEEYDNETAILTFQTEACGAVQVTFRPAGIHLRAERNGSDLILLRRTAPAADMPPPDRLTLTDSELEINLKP